MCTKTVSTVNNMHAGQNAQQYFFYLCVLRSNTVEVKFILHSFRDYKNAS